MALTISKDEIEDCVSMKDCIECLEKLFRYEGDKIARQPMRSFVTPDEDSVIFTMPALFHRLRPADSRHQLHCEGAHPAGGHPPQHIEIGHRIEKRYQHGALLEEIGFLSSWRLNFQNNIRSAIDFLWAFGDLCPPFQVREIFETRFFSGSSLN